MAEPFVGEIRLMAYGMLVPRWWAPCNGQILPINQYSALFSLLGTTYGGNGTTNFALPDLRGRVPIHVGNGHVQGEWNGAETVTLTSSQIPGHSHDVRARSVAGTATTPEGNYLAGANDAYTSQGATTTLHPGTVGPAGGDQAHPNMQPFLTLGFCIAIAGIYPSRS